MFRQRRSLSRRKVAFQTLTCLRQKSKFEISRSLCQKVSTWRKNMWFWNTHFASLQNVSLEKIQIVGNTIVFCRKRLSWTITNWVQHISCFSVEAGHRRSRDLKKEKKCEWNTYLFFSSKNVCVEDEHTSLPYSLMYVCQKWSLWRKQCDIKINDDGKCHYHLSDHLSDHLLSHVECDKLTFFAERCQRGRENVSLKCSLCFSSRKVTGGEEKVSLSYSRFS
jgi:hypothetical protein